MQARVPAMLAEFMKYKRIMNSEATEMLRSVQPRLGRQFSGEKEGRQETTTAAEAATTAAPETTVADATTAAPETTTAAEAAPDATTDAATNAATNATTAAPDATTEPATMTKDEIEESIEQAIDAIVNAVKETFEKFKEQPLSVSNIQSIGSGVINGIKNLLAQLGVAVPDKLPHPDVHFPDLPDIDFPDFGGFNLADWPLLCKVIWWPHEDDHCASMRCAACAPAMIAASRVCEHTEGAVGHGCMRSVLGDGSCQFCVVDYLK